MPKNNEISSPLFILGGANSTALYFMQHLVATGLTATVVSRSAVNIPQGFTNLWIDINKPVEWDAPQGAIIISFLPLWVLIDFLPRLTKAQAIIAIGSTSRFSKTNSPDISERSLAERLILAETQLQQWAESQSVTWTILRPTLVYDCKTDKNILRLANFIKRWHIMPIAVPANGLRQPIHADDVAKAAFKCLGNFAVANKAFNISGSEILSYRAMAERVFVALGKNPRFIRLPVSVLRSGFRVATAMHMAKNANFSAAMFERMNEDLIFPTDEGHEALHYQPRAFEPIFME